MSQRPDFNRVARPYDFISRLVFGNALVESQVSLLNHIPENSNILIVGGGTGWILDEISKIHNTGLNIVYVEASANMISLSRKRNVAENTVLFIHQNIETYHSRTLFDIVITPFFFDLFTKSDVSKLFLHIHKILKTNGLWLYTDFIPPEYQTRFWQKMLIKSMYLFFGMLSSVEARTLVNMDKYFEKDYTIIFEKWFFGKFIRSKVYQKRIYNQITSQIAQNKNKTRSIGQINFHQAFGLTLASANDGKIMPVGVINPIMPMPNK